jgi:glycosyltransferase involved in cell wall biosynthesis
VSLLCRPNTELARNAQALGFDVITIRIGGDLDPFVIWKARRLMKQKNIQVICTNMDKDLRFGGIAAKLARVPGVVPSREIDYPIKERLRYRFAYNNLATKIVFNSVATQRTVLNSAPWLDKGRTTVIYKGIDISKYDNVPRGSLRKELELSEDASIVTFVGRLDERKGIRYLLEAWKVIYRRHPSGILLLVGKGKMQREIEEFISTHDLASSVILVGFRTDVPSILLQSSMLVLPSLWEGFGYVLVEAMAARIPTVATATSSIPEIVEDKQSGILVEPKNQVALAEAISSLLLSPVRGKEMGLRGRQIVEERFTLSRMINEFERVFLTEAGK